MMDPVTVVGVDLDTKQERTLERCLERCEARGEVLWCRETGRGYHIRVRVPPCTYLESFIVRMSLGDDPARILFDLRRYVAGAMTGIDVLFDSKIIYHRPLGTCDG